MTAAGWVVGLHLWTTHFGACYPMHHECRQYESSTTGIYWRVPNGFTIGGYSNSYGRDSAYAGWTFETSDKRFALTLAGVTGYVRAVVIPLIAPSVRLGLSDGFALRISGAPKTIGGNAMLHISVEKQF